VSGAPSPGAVTFSLEELDEAALREAWIRLEARADITFYLGWSWIGAWIAEAGLPDCVLVGRAEGEIVALGLLRRALRRRHGFVRSRSIFLNETGDPTKDVIFIEYNGLLTDRRFGRLEAQAIAFLRAQQRAVGRFDEVQLGGFVEEAHDAVRKAGFRTQVHALKTTAFVDLAAIRAGGGDYLARVSANTRSQVRRALKIYQTRGPLLLERARSSDEALAFFEDMGVLHERRWRQRDTGGAWRFPFLVAFHRRVIETSFPEGGIDIVRVTCGGEPIGYIHCLVRGGWYGSYLSGFAYEEDNKVKPGLVSFYLYIEHLLKIDAQVLDFLAGDHRYKTSLGQPGANMYWFRVQERRPQLLLEDALRWAKQRLRRGSSGGD
jgi:CelD/BcsL family acetyltransferase involved in cellulose biosynthesis